MPTIVQASTETVLYSFAGGESASNVQAGLIQDGSGVLYGTSYGGGRDRAGTIFSLTPPSSGGTAWTARLLHQFDGAGGQGPSSPLLAGEAGELFGTTPLGGRDAYGTVFKLAPPPAGKTAWTETVLYSFKGGADGAWPIGGLIKDKAGALYGTTQGGGSAGAFGAGTVFKLTPPVAGKMAWTESILHSFTDNPGTDGEYPSSAGLIMLAGGGLVGASQGGTGNGIVFKLNPAGADKTPWNESIIYSFKGGVDGSGPGSLFSDRNGVLYGATAGGGTTYICSAGTSTAGCGTAFKLTPPGAGGGSWTETVLYRFKGGSDGAWPALGFVAKDGSAIYGTTTIGGISGRCQSFSGTSCGTVFKLSRAAASSASWHESVLHRFDDADGAYPVAGLVVDRNGALYGATSAGGASDAGTVFKVIP